MASAIISAVKDHIFLWMAESVWGGGSDAQQYGCIDFISTSRKGKKHMRLHRFECV